MSVPPGDQIYKQNADTRQECLHQSYSVVLLLYHRSKMLSIELGAQKNEGPIHLHCNVFTPKKHCSTTTFFCDFDGGNMIPYQVLKKALKALPF